MQDGIGDDVRAEPGTGFEPVAIIGAGVRMPGGIRSMDGLADVLWSGTDPVRLAPSSRWRPAATGPAAHDWGSFLDDLDQFDAAFFSISPREAESLDPQQRLLLEVGWEALESAGLDPRSLAGSATGVFAGLATSDYGRELMNAPASLDAYGASGTAYGTAVGRLSYTLDLLGPAIAVDTACSSSLVAIHLATQSLRLGESDLALAGGVNVILRPELGKIYDKARMLSPDGRCRSFSADANGYVRGEGCCLVVLQRLADAVAGGSRILGVICGSAVNQDGRSAGLTAPRSAAQRAVIASALHAARLGANDVSYVEAHGSGTPLGDTVEMEALAEALCQDRSDPLCVGSVKSNVGHLEAAGGAAGLLKVLLCFQRSAIPPNLHFAVPNPLIAWDEFPVLVPDRVRAWPPGTRPRRAGVNSFGFGGTNAHLVVEEPPPPPVFAPNPGAHLLPLSARSPHALHALVVAAREALTDRNWAAACQTAAVGRTHFNHRLAVIGRSAAELHAGLDAWLSAPTAVKPGAAPPLAFALSARSVNDSIGLERLCAHVPVLVGAGQGLQAAVAALLSRWGAEPACVVCRPGADIDEARAIGRPCDDPPAGSLVVDLATIGTDDPWRDFLQVVGRLYCAGVAMNWSAVYDGMRVPPIAWPTYPFQRRRHWSPSVGAFADPAIPETKLDPQASLPPTERERRLAAWLAAILLRYQTRNGEETSFPGTTFDLSLLQELKTGDLDPQIETAVRQSGDLTAMLIELAERSQPAGPGPVAPAREWSKDRLLTARARVEKFR